MPYAQAKLQSHHGMHNCKNHPDHFIVKIIAITTPATFINLVSAGSNQHTWTHAGSHLDKKLIWWLDNTKRCCQSSRHTDHTQDVANARRRLRRQAGECSHAAQRCSQVCHLMDVWIQARLSCIGVPAEECSCRKCVQVAVLRWIGCGEHKQGRLPTTTQNNNNAANATSIKATNYSV